MLSGLLKHTTLLIFAGFLLVSCETSNGDNNENGIDDFDRTTMLQSYSENYILPGYQDLKGKTETLHSDALAFTSSPNASNLETLRDAYTDALLSFQKVAFLNFGPASSINLIDQSNIFPTNTTKIESNIQTGSYNLGTSDNFSAKGFQAIDYLLYGIEQNESSIIQFYQDSLSAQTYLLDVINELKSNITYVVSTWQNTYANTFISNAASNSVGSSVSEIMNSISQYYEKYLRRGKLGLPLGIGTFSEIPLPDHVESYYQGSSTQYLEVALSSLQNFIEGKHWDGTNDNSGLTDYLDFVNATSNGNSLSSVVTEQFDLAEEKVHLVSDPLSESLTNESDLCRDAYEELQKLVPLIKVNMTSALGVQITYQDNDGD
jgi:predicted lipoprotein